jgi:hypothetical protein
MLCKHAIAVFQYTKEDPRSYQLMVNWYSISTYYSTYQYSIIPIRLEDFKDLVVRITDPMYGIDNPFAELIELKAKAPKLAKKKRIRKANEGKPKREIRCSHCRQIGHNRRGCRNGRKVPVVDISSEGNERTKGREGNEGSEGRDDAEDTSTQEETSEDELA